MLLWLNIELHALMWIKIAWCNVKVAFNIGAKMRFWLSSPARRRHFNLTMGAATAATLLFIL